MELRLVLCGIASLPASWIAVDSIQAQGVIVPPPAGGMVQSPPQRPTAMAATRLPVEQVPAELRERFRAVVERPTLRTQGVSEVFNCQPAFYLWLLDHPDVAVRLWHSLGVQCAPIEAHGEGRFSWQDAQGSNVGWTTVLRGPGQQVWFAEGRVKPSTLWPAATIRAVVCLNYRQGKDETDRPAIRHQVVVYLQTDSRAIALAARLVGASAPRVAEQYAGQIQTFYAGLAWYCDEHPNESRQLLRGFEAVPGADGRAGGANAPR